MCLALSSSALAGGWASLFASPQRLTLQAQENLLDLGFLQFAVGGVGEVRFADELDPFDLQAYLLLNLINEEKGSLTGVELRLDERLALEIGVRLGVSW